MLRTALPPEVVLRQGRVITRIDQEPGAGAPVRVGLDDGTVLAADLVLGADGLHSGVRRLVLGEEESFVRPLGYHTAAFTCFAPHLAERLGEDVHLTDVRDGQVGLFAVDLGRPAERPGDAGVVSAFVVTRGGADLPSDPQAAVRRELVRHGPVAQELLDRVPPDLYLDVVAQSVVPRWRRGRVVVVGDAAHAVSLLAGQGASLAIAGATALASHVRGARDLDEALIRYETSWRAVVEPVQATGRRAASAFVPRTRRDQWLRRMVLRAARLPGVDRRLTASITGAATH